MKNTDKSHIDAKKSAGPNFNDKLGLPGQYPYTRGIHPRMYQERLWTMRQYAGSGNAHQTNRLFRYLLAQGQTGLSVAFDLPTQLGYDSDSEYGRDEAGNVGVAIDSIADLRILFNKIPLDKVSVSMTINAPAFILMAMYMVLAQEQGVEKNALRGTIQNDILKEYVARGAYIFPPEPSLRLAADLIEYCSQECRSFNPISISGYHMREAGCTAAQEIGFTFANAIEYINRILRRGIGIDRFAPKLSFFFAAHNNFLEEVAKFRAARRLWARLMAERFKASNLDSMKLKFHTQTAGSTLTAQQPENNIARVALQALSAVLGGTQSLHTNSFDEALSLPSKKAATIALRTQQIIAHETGMTDVIDPLGGAYYIEELTDTIEKQALEYIDQIEKMGGIICAIEEGYLQRQIHEASYAHMLNIEQGRQVVVGVNKFNQNSTSKFKSYSNVDSDNDKQIKRLANLRAKRDERKVAESIRRIAETVMTDENLMPVALEAVANNCTIGEICGVLRENIGEYTERLSF